MTTDREIELSDTLSDVTQSYREQFGTTPNTMVRGGGEAALEAILTSLRQAMASGTPLVDDTVPEDPNTMTVGRSTTTPPY